jgi:hypothetical protein
VDVKSVVRFFNDPDFGVGQAVELVDKLVDLPVRRVDFTLKLLAMLGQGSGG